MNEAINPASAARQIRVGLIGAGNWANYGHLQALALLPQYRVVAVQARRRDAAQAAAERFGIAHVVDTVQALVALDDVDLVLVLNTAPQHAEAVKAAIAAGKDVFCEWPLTVDSATASELLDLAGAAGVRHVVGLQRRLAPHNRHVRDLIADGYVGKLRSVRLHVSIKYLAALRPAALRWTVPEENFSHVVSIYAGHYLDQVCALVGRPALLSALQLSQFPQITLQDTGEKIDSSAPDQLVMFARLAGDAVLSVQVEGGKRNGSGVQIDITGDEGDLRITNTAAFGLDGDDWIVQGAHGKDLPLAALEVPVNYHRLPPSTLPSAVLELADLYAAFAGNGDGHPDAIGVPTFEDAVWLHGLFDTIAESSATFMDGVSRHGDDEMAK